MKFIVFNVVVAVALVYLVANRDNGFDVSLPSLDDVSAAAEKTLDKVVPSAPEEPAIVDAPIIVTADLATRFSTPEPEVKVTPPVPVVEAPLPAIPEIKVPVREAHNVVVPPPEGATVDLAVAQRRAEVLGEGSVTAADSVQPTADRRRQLLDLAEEMEFLAAEFATQ
ncbi:MAG: hypothetical protein HKN28_12820 [Alphaproteobacteria bacterium]|nr:hypothetical protein [Alphaproteobacteria bacterium]